MNCIIAVPKTSLLPTRENPLRKNEKHARKTRSIFYLRRKTNGSPTWAIYLKTFIMALIFCPRFAKLSPLGSVDVLHSQTRRGFICTVFKLTWFYLLFVKLHWVQEYALLISRCRGQRWRASSNFKMLTVWFDWKKFKSRLI